MKKVGKGERRPLLYLCGIGSGYLGEGGQARVEESATLPAEHGDILDLVGMGMGAKTDILDEEDV